MLNACVWGPSQNKGLVTKWVGGGATKREGGGQVKFYPDEKGGGKSISHAEGGGAQKVSTP